MLQLRFILFPELPVFPVNAKREERAVNHGATQLRELSMMQGAFAERREAQEFIPGGADIVPFDPFWNRKHLAEPIECRRGPLKNLRDVFLFAEGIPVRPVQAAQHVV